MLAGGVLISFVVSISNAFQSSEACPHQDQQAVVSCQVVKTQLFERNLPTLSSDAQKTGHFGRCGGQDRLVQASTPGNAGNGLVTCVEGIIWVVETDPMTQFRSCGWTRVPFGRVSNRRWLAACAQHVRRRRTSSSHVSRVWACVLLGGPLEGWP